MDQVTLRVNESDLWILAYDIRCPKRLGRVHRAVRKWGTPLQYSVFLIKGKRDKLQELLDLLTEKLINTKEDDVRVYAVHASTPVWCLGQQQPLTTHAILMEAQESVLLD